MIKESKLSVYKDVWAIIKYDDFEIHEVYLKKEEAELDCIKKNEELEKLSHIKHRYEVKSLDDAIDIIKDSVRGDVY